MDREKTPDPFLIGKTRIFKPNLNSPRILAQQGWFTAHRFSKKVDSFVPLNFNTELKDHLLEARIKPKLQKKFLVDLNTLGVNYQTMFPDLEGVSRYMNWLHDVF